MTESGPRVERYDTLIYAVGSRRRSVRRECGSTPSC